MSAESRRPELRENHVDDVAPGGTETGHAVLLRANKLRVNTMLAATPNNRMAVTAASPQ